MLLTTILDALHSMLIILRGPSQFHLAIITSVVLVPDYSANRQHRICLLRNK